MAVDVREQQLARAHRSAVGVRLVIICNSYRDPERELA